MGQKVNPIGLRVGINRTWNSRWFAGRGYADRLINDLKLRRYVQDKLKAAGISNVVIERASKNTKVTVYTARPGVIIGKKGADIEKLRKDLSAQAGGEVSLNIIEIRKPESDAQLGPQKALLSSWNVAFRSAVQ
jgi:small subunit ribosomal protein S3